MLELEYHEKIIFVFVSIAVTNTHKLQFRIQDDIFLNYITDSV